MEPCQRTCLTFGFLVHDTLRLPIQPIHGVAVFLLVELLPSCEVLEQHPSDVVTEILEEIMTYRP